MLRYWNLLNATYRERRLLRQTCKLVLDFKIGIKKACYNLNRHKMYSVLSMLTIILFEYRKAACPIITIKQTASLPGTYENGVSA